MLPSAADLSQSPPGPPPGWWSWLAEFGSQPGVVESLLALVLLAALGFVWWRIRGFVARARGRQALEDYLFGVEQALHGDLHGARERLEKVLAKDPENHFARLLLGKVLAGLGEPEQAHQQHLYLQRAFGIDSPENELLLARSLLGAGLAQEAAETAERALRRLPEHAEGWEFAYRARLQTGDFDAAAVAGRRLLDLLRDGPARDALRSDVARTLAQAGSCRLQRGDAAGANAALQQARRLDEGAAALPLLAARLEAQHQGLAATVAGLLAAPAGALVPVAAPGPSSASTGLPVATFAGLVAPTRWRCRRCEAPLSGPLVECPRCSVRGGAELGEPQLVAGLDSPTHTMDAIDENEAHVQRLVRTALDGERDGAASARRELVELRERAVEELLRQAWQRSDSGRDAAITILREMGPAIAPALFAASDALEQARLLPIGGRSPAAVVGRIVQGFDRSAMPHVESLFASAKPEHRKILIDYFLGLADLGAFQIVLERFPPLEILHRLNKADSEVLRRFLQAVPPGHFVADSLLLEPTFYREEDVLAAIPGARHPEVLEGALLRRGPTRTLTKAAIAALAEPRLADVAEQLLGRLGEAVLDHVLGAFTDPERPAADRQRLANVLVRAGAAAVDRLCGSFGPEPAALDDALLGVLVRLREAAVEPLQAAYGHSGWLEKVSLGLVSRHTNRRVQIVRALAAIGGKSAVSALRALADGERDDNLRLRLHQALHELGAEGGDGQGR